MSTESYCIPENEVSSYDIISPSGNYKLIIKSYKTKQGCWNYTSGSIYRKDNSLITTIYRNYSTFNYTFFKRNGVEWLYTGKTYLSQCLINLETCEIYDNSTDKSINSSSFCWVEVIPNPSGTLFAVIGCVWGGPYETLFYDFNDLEAGLSLIPFKNYSDNYFLDASNEYSLKWIDDTNVEYIYFKNYSIRFNKTIDDLTIEELDELPDSDDEYVQKVHYSVSFKYDENAMCCTDTNSSDEHIQEIKENELYIVKEKQFNTDLYASKRYLMLKEAFNNLSVFFFCHNGKFLDFDSPIEETHFSVNFIYENTDVDIRCYCDHNTVTIEDKTEEFKTIEEVINYVKNYETLQ